MIIEEKRWRDAYWEECKARKRRIRWYLFGLGVLLGVLTWLETFIPEQLKNYDIKEVA